MRIAWERLENPASILGSSLFVSAGLWILLLADGLHADDRVRMNDVEILVESPYVSSGRDVTKFRAVNRDAGGPADIRRLGTSDITRGNYLDATNWECRWRHGDRATPWTSMSRSGMDTCDIKFTHSGLLEIRCTAEIQFRTQYGMIWSTRRSARAEIRISPREPPYARNATRGVGLAAPGILLLNPYTTTDNVGTIVEVVPDTGRQAQSYHWDLRVGKAEGEGDWVCVPGLSTYDFGAMNLKFDKPCVVSVQCTVRYKGSGNTGDAHESHTTKFVVSDEPSLKETVAASEKIVAFQAEGRKVRADELRDAERAISVGKPKLLEEERLAKIEATRLERERSARLREEELERERRRRTDLESQASARDHHSSNSGPETPSATSRLLRGVIGGAALLGAAALFGKALSGDASSSSGSTASACRDCVCEGFVPGRIAYICRCGHFSQSH